MQQHKLAPNSFQKRQGKDNQKHNTAITSLEAFKAINESGQRFREKQKVLEAIKQHQPVTSRSLSILTGIERTNITRSLFDLVHDTTPEIKEAFIAKCAVTNKKVKYYALINWPQIQLF